MSRTALLPFSMELKLYVSRQNHHFHSNVLKSQTFPPVDCYLISIKYYPMHLQLIHDFTHWSSWITTVFWCCLYYTKMLQSKNYNIWAGTFMSSYFIILKNTHRTRNLHINAVQISFILFSSKWCNKILRINLQRGGKIKSFGNK